MKIIFDKFYISSNAENKTSKIIEKETDSFNEINLKVTQKISSEIDVDKKIIIVPIKKISANYTKLFEDCGLEILELDLVYNDLLTNGINPFYWKATNMEGHWNHAAHEAIGLHIANYLSKQNN